MEIIDEKMLHKLHWENHIFSQLSHSILPILLKEGVFPQPTLSTGHCPVISAALSGHPSEHTFNSSGLFRKGVSAAELVLIVQDLLIQKAWGGQRGALLLHGMPLPHATPSHWMPWAAHAGCAAGTGAKQRGDACGQCSLLSSIAR